MAWLSLIVELIGDLIVKASGFILGILALYFMWKSRTASYRDILYSKQLDTYVGIKGTADKIMMYIIAYNYACEDIYKRFPKKTLEFIKKKKKDSKEIREINKNVEDILITFNNILNGSIEIFLGHDLKYEELRTKFFHEYIEASNILQEDVADALNEFRKLLPLTLGDISIYIKYQKKIRKDEDLIGKTWEKIHPIAERRLGITPLTKETTYLLRKSFPSTYLEKQLKNYEDKKEGD
ncbi:hypothetical protein KAX08_02975 [candidate division WOR-3 bacterium]|nr:hypothetical protein [candidate division WOR-3 bacterium]